MRIGSTAAPEHVKFTPCAWPKFHVYEPADVEKRNPKPTVMVEVRPVPPEVERAARDKHLGAKAKVEYLDQANRPGFRPDRSAPTVRRQEFNFAQHEAFTLELATYAMGNIYAAEPGESVEHYLVDAEAAAIVWKLLTKNQRDVIGELKAGDDLKLDGLLRENEDLRRWKLSTDPSLLEFVQAEAVRLRDEHTGAEQGKG